MKERKFLKWAAIIFGICIGSLFTVFKNLDEPIDTPLGKFLLFILAMAVIELFVSIILIIVYFVKKSKKQVLSLQESLREGSKVIVNGCKQCPNCHANVSVECTVCPCCKKTL